MRSLSPNMRQIMKERVEGARYHSVKSWREMIDKPDRKVTEALTRTPKKTRSKELTKSKAYYSKAVTDSMSLDKQTLNEVVTFVNAMSRQLRRDMEVQPEDDPLEEFKENIAALESP